MRLAPYLLVLCLLTVSIGYALELPHSGYYRYGSWVTVASGGEVTSPGSYQFNGIDSLLFRPGLVPTESYTATLADGSEEPVTGLQQLKEDDRLVCWYGYNGDVTTLVHYTIGEDRFVIVPGSDNLKPLYFDSVDIVVFEKYPTALHTRSNQEEMLRWLTNGGVAVLTSRESLSRGNTSIFNRFLADEKGKAVSDTIRERWQAGVEFASDEFYRIPAGNGSLILFPGDRRGVGIDAAIAPRLTAWQAISRLAQPDLFPGRTVRADLEKVLHNRMVINGSDFSSQGTGLILFIYIVSVLWIIHVTRGVRRRLMVLGVSAVLSLLIILVYAHADIATRQLSLLSARNGETQIALHRFLKAAPFTKGEYRFLSDAGDPWYPLLPEKGNYAIEAASTYQCALKLPSRSGRILARQEIWHAVDTGGWTTDNGRLSLDLPPGVIENTMFWFDNGNLYPLPGFNGVAIDALSVRIEDLGAPLKNVDQEVLDVLRMGRMLSLSSDRFLLVKLLVPDTITSLTQSVVDMRSEGFIFINE